MVFTSPRASWGVILSLVLSLPHAAHSLTVRNNNKVPTPRQWAALNTTVGGRLFLGTPWSLPCFSKYNGQPVHPDSEECDFIQDNTYNSHMNRSDHFGTYMGTQWETCMSNGDQCVLNHGDPEDSTPFAPPAQCLQGSVANYYIDVRDKSDIIAAYEFSKTTGYPLIIKNTGHDLQGRSAAPNSLALWMHHMKHIAHEPNFVAEGCPKSTGSVLTFGAGQQFEQIYKFADDNDLMYVGGSDQSVGGAGGWIQGGGHSPLSPTLGLGVDRVLQYKIVTADGVYRVVNACQNPDLFFALRGGGGGTFGVVLEVSVRAEPRVNFRVANINWKPSNENYEAVLKIFLENATTLAEQGWGGYVTPLIGNIILISPRVNLTVGQKSFQALIDLTTKMGGVSNVTEMSSFNTWFQMYVQGTSGTQDPVGLPSALSSRLIPQENHATAEGRAALLNAVMESHKSVFFTQIHFTTPYGVTDKSKANGTSVTPAWRNSLWQILLADSWAWNATLSERQAAYDRLGKGADLFRKLAPRSGAYQNEADIHEPHHEEAFWGPHYPALLQAKAKYDPHHLLDCWNCVGSTGPRNPRFSCYI